MKISIVTLFPKMIEGFFNESIICRAIKKKIVEIEIVNLRDFAIDSYGTVDDRPYGGGAGMILRADVVWAALNKFKVKNPKFKIKKIITSPKGVIFNQARAIEYSKLDHLIIIAGHYEGIDERILAYVDEEISMGDFVITGGEIVSAAIADAVARLIPGVLKKKDATTLESFSLNNKKLLEYPQYTRPEEFMGKKVPKILLCGDPKKIDLWRQEKAIVQTKEKRPDLFSPSSD